VFVGIYVVHVRAVHPNVVRMSTGVQMQSARLHAEHCNASKGED